MSTTLGYLDTNTKIEQAFNTDLASKYKNVEKKASEAIGSFAKLVDELIKLKELSTGTQAKQQITKLTTELNNSSVFFTKMISEELGSLHNIINPNTTTDEATELPA